MNIRGLWRCLSSFSFQGRVGGCVLACLLLFCLCSCKEKESLFVLDGNIRCLTHDTIYIYGADGLYEQLDTVVTHEGRFKYTAAVDTVTPLWILFPNKHRELLFADKGLSTTMSGDTAATGCIHVVGGEQDALLRNFHLLTDTLDDSNRVVQIVDSFIRANPHSEVSIYLLREYFVNNPKVNQAKLNALIASMSGNLQDNDYIRQLQQTLSIYKPLTRNNAVSNLTVQDREGKAVGSSEYKDTFLLVTFWASWDAESRQRQRELIPIKEKYKSHNFDILSISLDGNREAWLKAVDEDSVTWRQACDFKGWATDVVKRMQIDHLPANVLLNPSRRIQAIDIYGEELDRKIDELTEKTETKKSKQKKNPQNIRNIKKK